MDSPWGTYCYTVMPFGLKNAGATYQRAATALFHEMIHKEVEVYVDDMIIKSQERNGHLPALKMFFERLRKFDMKLNPQKCVFGVTKGKLLGYVVSQKGIEPYKRCQYRGLRKKSEGSWVSCNT